MNGDELKELPEMLRNWEGIPDRTILILTAEKLAQHIKQHATISEQNRKLRNQVIAASLAGASSLVAVIIKTIVGK